MELSKSPLLNVEPLTLRATGAGIKIIDVLPPKLASSISLYVSSNKIETIENIIQFKSLESFLAEYNNIRYLDDLLPLAELNNLKRVRLEGNPLTEISFWEIFLIGVNKSITKINGRSVEEILGAGKDREWAENFVKHEQKGLNYIAQLEFIKSVIRTGKYPLKSKYEEVFSAFFDQRKLFAFYDSIRRAQEYKTPEDYIKYLDTKLKNKSLKLVDICEDNGVPGHILAKLNKATNSAHAYINIIKEFIDFKEDLDQKPTTDSLNSFIVRGDAVDTMSLISGRNRNSDTLSRKSYISSPSRFSPSKRSPKKKKQAVTDSSYDVSNMSSFAESGIAKKETSQADNIEIKPLPTISEIDDKGNNDEHSIEDKETLMNTDELNDTNTELYPQTPIDDKQDYNDKSLNKELIKPAEESLTHTDEATDEKSMHNEKEDIKNDSSKHEEDDQMTPEIEEHKTNDGLSSPQLHSEQGNSIIESRVSVLRRDDVIMKFFSIWKQRSEMADKVTQFSQRNGKNTNNSLEKTDDSISLIRQLKEKRLLLIKIEQQKEINSALRERVEQLDKELTVKTNQFI